MTRSTREVFEDHLRLRAAGKLDEGLDRNYADDVVLLTVNSVLRGQDGLRESARRLRRQLPDAKYHYESKQVDGEFALLVWYAESDRFRVDRGADSFLIRDGRIVMQTVHNRLMPMDDSPAPAPDLPAP